MVTKRKDIEKMLRNQNESRNHEFTELVQCTCMLHVMQLVTDSGLKFHIGNKVALFVFKTFYILSSDKSDQNKINEKSLYELFKQERDFQRHGF